jgi:hypothetical protein
MALAGGLALGCFFFVGGRVLTGGFATRLGSCSSFTGGSLVLFGSRTGFTAMGLARFTARLGSGDLFLALCKRFGALCIATFVS